VGKLAVGNGSSSRQRADPLRLGGALLMQSTGGHLEIPLSGAAKDIEFLALSRTEETEGEQFNRIPLPKQLMHPEFRNLSSSGNRNWAALEYIVRVFHVGNLVFTCRSWGSSSTPRKAVIFLPQKCELGEGSMRVMW
jgi:hypothetical protein